MNSWQPISTAPKNGDFFDVWDKRGFRLVNRYFAKKEMVFMPGQLQKLEKYFTHWAPIVGPEINDGH